MHNFILSYQYYSITPLDYAAITGLRFDGEVVNFNCTMSSGNYWPGLVLKLLGD